MQRTALTLSLVVLLAGVPTQGVFGVTPAFAHEEKGKTVPHKNLEEALQHFETHVRDLRAALKAGYKMNPSMEKGLIFDIEHVEKMMADELAKAKKK